jgi:outer membrane protein assembly factor BamA
MRHVLGLLIGLVLCVPAGIHAASDSGCAGGFSRQLIPLPIIATLPNEGNTYGVMPVFLLVCDATARTESITAPSITWNDVIHVTGTLRWFYYPTDEQTLNLIVTASTRINSGVLLQWRDHPLARAAFTTDIDLRWQRSVFYRFFGFGPDTPPSAETSYTRIRAHASARRGLNFGGHWNVGVGLLLHRDDVQDVGVPGLPLSRRVFPTAPGMAGSTKLAQALDLRFDSRPNVENSDRGLFADAGVAVVEGLAGSPNFLRGELRVRALHPEAGWITGATRFDWTSVSTPRAPFYDQGTLGGPFLLRGFTEDRFIDQSAWTFEVEQRIRLFTTHIYGVTTDWRIDPFVGVGQVYRSLPQAFSNPRFTTGVGLRAFVRPNVLGRVDVATGGEGWKVYVEIGYPY